MTAIFIRTTELYLQSIRWRKDLTFKANKIKAKSILMQMTKTLN
jgi:hypothetical protein